MARFDTSLKPKEKPFAITPGVKKWAGVGFIVLAVIVLAVGMYEVFLGGGKIKFISLPGFHEVKIDAPGAWAGVYQHRGAGPMPLKELSQMDVRILAKDTYEDVPVLMNSAAQGFSSLGFQGVPLFNFVVPRAGSYTLSGVYVGDLKGPSIPLVLIPQTAQNIRQTLLVTAGLFVLFLVLGIVVLIRHSREAKDLLPKKK